jgi:hypothetical protein
MMKVTLKKGQPASMDDIKAFEASSGLRLPLEYRKFLLRYNGARPGANIFMIPGGNNSGVNDFLPLKEIKEERDYIDGVACQFIPIADASCGNYVCMNLDKGGEIFFWDHELPSSNPTLATDFDSFLNMLEPFDIAAIKLYPEEMKGGWIDPDFLKAIQQQEREEGEEK